MIRCPSCGQVNPDGFRMCGFCGKPLPAGPAAPDVRKTVTVLFSDVTGSTALGEQLDPESLRSLMGRYFAEIKAIIEGHGGTVEKFIGDAVMAVFGIPTLHEDDALRAVRAAADIRGRLAALNADLSTARGLTITLRTGVTTGEVVAGDPASGQTLVTGDTVNTAARLEQAAAPGEILLGQPTYRLVRDAVSVEAVEPISAKGKTQPVAAYRLVAVTPGVAGHARHLTAPMIGRQAELAFLREVFARCLAERRPQLVTLLGLAGVGKSRLVAEFVASSARQAMVMRGRCLPYGEGITYWPLREIVHAATGIDEADTTEAARRKLEALLESAPQSDEIARGVRAVIGLESEVISQEQSFWSARRFFELLAHQRPLLVVIEDIHWAEPTLLDLLEYLTDLGSDVPLLLLCPARPELLDAHPGWGGHRPNRTVLQLEPLFNDASEQLLDDLPGGRAVPLALRGRILAAAEGNPLYLEEMLSMLIEEGYLARHDGTWHGSGELEQVEVPPSVRSLLAARIDALPLSERQVASRASVIGREFEGAAVRELSTDVGVDVGRSLLALIRKELLRPERAELTAGDAFKFRHVLIRDAAYDALPKAERAKLHERFADWLERIVGDRLTEYQEVVGFHLEQAHAFRIQLGVADAKTASLGSRAADRLGAAAMRAEARRDAPAADSLLARTIALTPNAPERGRLMLRRVQFSYSLGETQRIQQLLAEAVAIADGEGDELLRAHADMFAAYFGLLSDPTATVAALLSRADRTEALAIERKNLRSQVQALQARAFASEVGTRYGQSVEALERAIALVDELDDPESQVLAADARQDLMFALGPGPTPAQEALARIDQLDPAGQFDVRYSFGARLLAMRGRFEEARARVRTGLARLKERGLHTQRGSFALVTADVETLAGDLEAGLRLLDEGIGLLQPLGVTGVLSSLAAAKAIVLYRLGRTEEIQDAIGLAQRTGAIGDVLTQASWRIAAAQQAADVGAIAAAETLIADAVALVEPSDDCYLRGQVYEAQANVEGRAGHVAGWREAMERAIAEHDRKGNLVDGERLRNLLSAGPRQPARM